MSDEEIQQKVRVYYQDITSKIKGYIPGNLDVINGEVVNKCLDYYFSVRAENEPKQLELEF